MAQTTSQGFRLAGLPYIHRGDYNFNMNLLNTILSGLGGVVTFADKEVPSGALNGSNVTFTLAHAPATGSLLLFLNGQLLTDGGVDYTLVGSTITYVTAPQAADRHVASYRY